VNYLYRVNITGGNFELASSGGIYLQNVVIDNNTELSGQTYLASDNEFNGNVVNNGDLYNRNDNHFTASFNNNLTNNGTIQNNNHNLYLNISGNVENNGTWTNNTVYLNGGTGQEISCLNGNVFACDLLLVPGTGLVTALSDLAFSDCNIEFQNKELQMPAGSILSFSGYNRRLNQINITGGDFELAIDHLDEAIVAALCGLQF
jgi:hypothetical protein